MREDRSKAMAIMGDHDYLLRFWNDLTEDEKNTLVTQFTSYRMTHLTRAFRDFDRPPKVERVEPIDKDHCTIAANLDEGRLDEYWGIGLEVIAKGEVAAVALAGGQATRLGAAQPKGTVSLGFNLANVPDSLLALQASRISRLEHLARAAYPHSDPRIWWIVMVSEATRQETTEHLHEICTSCGIVMDQILIIVQGTLPCFDVNGNLFLSSKCSFAVAPDGNGGLYKALIPYLDFFYETGVKYFHVYCVDNVLCRVADPHFLGYCIKKQADCAAKAVEKIEPSEKLGVICRARDGIRVVEYSEIPEELSVARDETGHLKFRSGNIANHFFSIEFIERVCASGGELPFHRAFKKIPFIDRNTGILVKPEAENGYKLEQFIFDAFKYAVNFHVWEVNRAAEFSPLKNADSVGTECLTTCRRDYYAECKRWLDRAGVQTDSDRPIFIHPLFSYAGEALEEYRKAPVKDDIAP